MATARRWAWSLVVLCACRREGALVEARPLPSVEVHDAAPPPPPAPSVERLATSPAMELVHFDDPDLVFRDGDAVVRLGPDGARTWLGKARLLARIETDRIVSIDWDQGATSKPALVSTPLGRDVPTRLALVAPIPRALACDADTVYVARADTVGAALPGDGEILAVDAGSGAVRSLVKKRPMVNELVLDGAWVYWTEVAEACEIRRVPKAGGAHAKVADCPQFGGRLVVTRGEVAFVDDAILRVRDGRLERQAATEGASAAALDGDEAFFLTERELRVVRRGDSTSRELAVLEGAPKEIAVSPRRIVWTTSVGAFARPR